MKNIEELQTKLDDLTRERDMLRARIVGQSARIKALSEEVVKLRLSAVPASDPVLEQERDPKRIVAAAQALAKEIIRQAKRDAKVEAKQIIRAAKEREQAKKQAAREAAQAKKQAEREERERLEAMRPRLINFRYCNLDNEITTRTVEVEYAYRGPSGYQYFRGFCRLRGEGRTFRLDRVMGNIINEATGEVLTWIDFARLWEII